MRSFSQFLNLAAARHSQAFHPAEMARELGITQPTVKAWAGVLEASYTGHFLPPWSRNYGKRVMKTPKFYFLDTALASLLTRQPKSAAALAGVLLEGWVVIEAVKAFMALGRKPELYFWRSHDGLEVDLLIVIDGKLQPVEVKLTASPGAGHAGPIEKFLAVAGDKRRIRELSFVAPNSHDCYREAIWPYPGGIFQAGSPSGSPATAERHGEFARYPHCCIGGPGSGVP